MITGLWAISSGVTRRPPSRTEGDHSVKRERDGERGGGTDAVEPRPPEVLHAQPRREADVGDHEKPVSDPHPGVDAGDRRDGEEDRRDREHQPPDPQRQRLLDERRRGGLGRPRGDVVYASHQPHEGKQDRDPDGVGEPEAGGLPRAYLPGVRGGGDGPAVDVHSLPFHFTGRSQSAYHVTGPSFRSRVSPARRWTLSIALSICAPQRPSTSTE